MTDNKLPVGPALDLIVEGMGGLSIGRKDIKSKR
jgi:hypothetical protein